MSRRTMPSVNIPKLKNLFLNRRIAFLLIVDKLVNTFLGIKYGGALN